MTDADQHTWPQSDRFYGHHFGRSWTGHPLEDDCPCPKAPCGLVVYGQWAQDCDQHNPQLHPRTIRQTHPAGRCPAGTDSTEPPPSPETA